MRQLFLVAVLALLVLSGVGFLLMGAFPPSPHPQQVQHVVPNDRFQPH